MSTSVSPKGIGLLDYSMISITIVSFGIQLWLKTIAYLLHPVGRLNPDNPVFENVVRGHTEVWRLSMLLALATIIFSVVTLKASSLPKWARLINIVLAACIAFYSITPPV